MRRRDALIGAASILISAPVLAQPKLKQHRIAFVHSAFPAEQLTEAAGPFWVRSFFEELRRSGYTEGQNLAVERYSALGDRLRHAQLAAEIAARNPALIVANSNLLVDALRTATQTIPIVGVLGDPLSYGTVANLARPEGNVTGVSIDAGIQVNGKRLALLKQAIPSASRIAFLTLPADWDGAGGLDVRRAAERIGVTVVGSSPRDGSETALRDVFVTALADGVNGLAVSASGEWLPRRETIVQLAREYRVPAMYPYRDFVEVGGLMAYTPDLRETATHLADAVAQVLRGKHPRDIPIQQATKFSLVLNLVAARELGTAVSAVVLAQANEVIE